MKAITSILVAISLATIMYMLSEKEGIKQFKKQLTLTIEWVSTKKAGYTHNSISSKTAKAEKE